jgi:hypothetical protein
MPSRIWKSAAAIASLAAMGGLASPASAGTGCNGVVNILVWGCAPWDNNNGPRYPYYKKQKVTLKVPQGSKITIKDGHAVVTIGGRDYPVVNGVSGVVSAGGGNVVAAGGGNVVAAGGMNLQVWQAN